MPWIVAAKFAVLKKSPRLFVARFARLTVSWAVRKVDFHAFQSLALEERLSQFGRSSGKLPTERSEEDGMATIHW